MSKPVIFLELNEVNISLVERYLEDGTVLPGWYELLRNGYIKTHSEQEYRLIEPWIQWVSIHTGQSFEEHGVYRLGDMATNQTQQIFERLEADGFKVGCLSPMNTRNNLKEPAFFIPDPWTKTPTDGSWYSNYLWQALEQAVNDNAQQKITKRTLIKLFFSVAYLVPIKKIPFLIKKLWYLKNKKYGKALFLDLLLSEIFSSLTNWKKPDFGVLFLNSFAHIQHHYYYSSEHADHGIFKNPSWYIDEASDPIKDAIVEYDYILQQWLQEDVTLVAATGLKQVAYPNPQFYYRLREHADFLTTLGITFKNVLPRMTRDFLVQFSTNSDRDFAAGLLRKASLDGTKVFDEIQIRDHELFVTLTYPKEIKETSTLIVDEKKINNFDNHVVFVALKNGHHDQQGYLCSNNPSILQGIDQVIDITKVSSIIERTVRLSKV